VPPNQDLSLVLLDSWQREVLLTEGPIEFQYWHTPDGHKYTQRGQIFLELVEYKTIVHLGRIGRTIDFLGTPLITADDLEMSMLEDFYQFSDILSRTDLYDIYKNELERSPEDAISWLSLDIEAGRENRMKYLVAANFLGCRDAHAV